MALTTRLAGEADAAAIARIYSDGIADRVATFETEPRAPADIAKMLVERGERFPSVVAERDGRVVAWAGTSPYRSRPAYAGVAEFSVYVAREARGTGAGSAALSTLVEVCEARGFWKLLSRIFPENAASRALCRKHGFREVGVYVRHGRLDGQWKDCVIVERLLGEAARP